MPRNNRLRHWMKCSIYKWVSEVAQSCPTLCDPMDCSLPGSSVHGIFQAIVLEWITISFSRVSSQPRDWTQVSHIVDRCFPIWATREVSHHQTLYLFCVWYPLTHGPPIYESCHSGSWPTIKDFSTAKQYMAFVICQEQGRISVITWCS